jgi:hypothetical protein
MSAPDRILLPGTVSAPGLFTFFIAAAGSLLSSYNKVNSGILYFTFFLSFLPGTFLLIIVP